MTPEDMLGLMRKVAWSYIRQAPNTVDPDELINEAFLAYKEALVSFDEEKGKFSTWLWHCARRRIQRYLYNEKKQVRHLTMEEVPGSAMMIETKPLYELIEQLGDTAKEVCQIIVDNPQLFASLGRGKSKAKLQQTLRERGWQHKKIQGAFAELQTAMGAH